MPPAVTTPLVSVEEYLRTSYKPACEYIDGELRQRPMPTSAHADVQSQIGTLVNTRFPSFVGSTELTVKLRENKFLIPDVSVRLRAGREIPYPTKPIHLCVEIMSSEDRFIRVLGKCDEYLEWGVPTTWIIDPENRRAWQFEAWPPEEIQSGGQLKAGEIAIPVDDIFKILDE